MQTKFVDYAILYNETNQPIDIIQELNHYEHEPVYHRSRILMTNGHKLTHANKQLDKVDFYSFAGTLPLKAFIDIKKKVEKNYPNLDVHFIRNDETPLEFILSTGEDEPLPNELLLTLGTFFSDNREKPNLTSHQAIGKIPGTVFVRAARKIETDFPHVTLTKNI